MQHGQLLLKTFLINNKEINVNRYPEAAIFIKELHCEIFINFHAAVDEFLLVSLEPTI